MYKIKAVQFDSTGHGCGFVPSSAWLHAPSGKFRKQIACLILLL